MVTRLPALSVSRTAVASAVLKGRPQKIVQGGELSATTVVLPAGPSVERLRSDEQQAAASTSLSFSLGGLVSVVFRASASIPSCTPARLTFVVSGHADTIDSCHAHSASGDDLRDQALRLANRRYRRCLY